MRLMLFGKFPPIQGGVSMRNYYYAHGLAALGHEVHVITNADEAKPPFRMFMRPEDWERCEEANPANKNQADDVPLGQRRGSVTVHWTEPAGIKQYYIPMASPFVTKLTSLGLIAAAGREFDAVFSFYMEPYGVAGHTVARELGLPHVFKTAGSDAGRLWQQPQMKPLYDRIFQAADALIVGGTVADQLTELGIPRERFMPDAAHPLPEDLFSPEGPALDFAALDASVREDPVYGELCLGKDNPDLTWIGVYGKLGESKGSFSLLQAVRDLADKGVPIGVRLMAHGRPPVEKKFRAHVAELKLEDRVHQIPFLPHWRVPEFIRSCVAICCLEQDFDIAIHNPIAAREVLTAGACLIGSMEMINKLPAPHRLADRVNCIALPDVHDVPNLAARIGEVVGDPEAARQVGAAGRIYALAVQPRNATAERLARALEWVVEQRAGTSDADATGPGDAAVEAAAGSTESQPPDSGKPASPHPLAALARDRLASQSDTSATDGANKEPPQYAGALDTVADLKAFNLWLMARADDAGSVEQSDQAPTDGPGAPGPAADRSQYLRDLAECVRLDMILAELEAPVADAASTIDRYTGALGGFRSDSLGELIPTALENISLVEFDVELNQLLAARQGGDLPASFDRGPSWLVRRPSENARGAPTVLVLSAAAAISLAACDGRSSVEVLSTRLAAENGDAPTELFTGAFATLFDEALICLGPPRHQPVDADKAKQESPTPA